MNALDVDSPGDDGGAAAWCRLEQRYRRASWNYRPAEIISARYGHRGVLLTAPHAGHQMRNNWPKPADGGTGGLAEVVARRLGCAVVTVAGIQADDPNWDSHIGDFKRAALRHLAADPFTFDIHAMRRDRSVDICIGTGLAPDAATLRFARECAARARAAGFLVSVNHPFPAAREGTMTTFTQRAGHRALQIEVNGRFLDPEGDPDAARRIIAMLTAFVEAAPPA